MMFAAVEAQIQPFSDRDNPKAPIDREHLARYTMNDQALEREILDLFSITLTQSLKTLTEAENPTDWAMAAHTLKGSARAVGAWQLAALMEDAEQMNIHREMDQARRDLLIDIKVKAVETKNFIVKLEENV